MRIISGIFRGKKILAPASLPVRPTTDFAKTGLFNLIENRFDISAISVIDLYAGTGSVSYEFFSRGCVHLQAVDRNRDCVSFIRRTFESLHAPRTVSVHQSDAVNYLQSGSQYDVIFADPPFESEVAEELLEVITTASKLKPRGVFILEHITGKNYSSLPGFEETRKYGNVSFTFFQL